MPANDGPVLALAVICERVLREVDGAMSIIRIVDRWQIVGSSPHMQVTTIPLSIAIMLRSGKFRGRVTVTIRATAPSGKQLIQIDAPILFEGEGQDERGAFIAMNLGFVAEEEGLYWFTLLLNQEAATRIPLRVAYQRTPPVQAQLPPP